MGLQEKFNILAVRNRFIPGWMRFLLIVPGLIIGLYWWYSFTGLYRYLANLQLDIVGSYETILTGLLVLFIFICPAVLIMFLIAPYYERRAMRGLATSAESSSFSERLNAFVLNKPLLFRVYMFGLVGAVIFGGAALYFFLQYSLISSQIINLDSGHSTGIANISGPTYAMLTGKMDCDSLYLLEETINSSNYLVAYARIIDTRESLKNIFLEKSIYKDEEYCRDEVIPIKGIMRPYGLPGMVRDEYIDRGILSADAEYVVIEYGAKPGEMNSLAGVFAFLAFMSFGVFLFIYIRKRPLI